MATHLSANPVLDGKPVVTLSPNERQLGPIDGKIIDVELTLSTAKSHNIICHFLAVVDLIVYFDNNGEPILK